MFVTPAYAQSAGGSGDIFSGLLLPLLLILPIFYFFLIRPQQKQMKARQAMLDAVRRNDDIITSGGISAKVTKVIDDNYVEIEIAKDVRVKLLRSYIASVDVKGEPVNDNASKPAAKKAAAKKPAAKKPAAKKKS